MNARLALTLGALLAFIAVALGAFGAHALRSRLAPEMTSVWQTAVQYHGGHALALLAVGMLLLHWPDRGALIWAGWSFVVGIALFSGSLYVMALTGAKYLGVVTPIGGVAFLAGWIMLAWSAWKS